MNLKDLHVFVPNSLEDWEKTIQKELAGKNLDELNWTPEDGLNLAPYLTESPASIHSPLSASPFLIHQSVTGESDAECNTQGLQSLSGGVQSLGFERIPSNWTDLLKDIEWPFIQVHVNEMEPLPELRKSLLEVINTRGWKSDELNGFVGCDVSYLWNTAWKADDIREIQNKWRRCRLFSIDGFGMASCGANATQQISGILAQAQEALHQLTQKGFSIDDASAMLQINVCCDTNYFLEMAKLRVIKSLYAEIVQAYSPQHACSTNVWVHARIGGITFANVDTDTNLLRATTAAMSAAIGQASSIEIMPHHPFEDAVFSMRIARNILHLLREESYFDLAVDAIKGSYFIENTCLQLAQNAWAKLLDIESKGGWTSVQNIWTKEAVDELEKRYAAIDSQAKVLVGVNKYKKNG